MGITSLVTIEDVRYGTGGGVPLLLDILRPEPRPAAPMPVVVEVHGGAWMEGEKDAARNRLFAEHGFFTASVDYRLSGVAPFPAQIHDVKAAIRWLRAHAGEHGLDPGRIGVWGHSAGGHLSALLGTSHGVPELEGEGGSRGFSSRVQAVVDISGPTDALHGWEGYDLADSVYAQLFWGPMADRLDLVRSADPRTYLREDAPPFLIIHGDRDETVPINHAEVLYEALTARGVEAMFLRIEGGDHLLDGHWADIGQRALEFFRRYLKPSGG
jgi:acetyl esterase/lipase